MSHQHHKQENNKEVEALQQDAIQLLKALIAIPSFSKEESNTSICIQQFFETDMDISDALILKEQLLNPNYIIE